MTRQSPLSVRWRSVSMSRCSRLAARSAIFSLRRAEAWPTTTLEYLETMKLRVREELAEHWPTVARVASALLERGSISGIELKALLP